MGHARLAAPPLFRPACGDPFRCPSEVEGVAEAGGLLAASLRLSRMVEVQTRVYGAFYDGAGRRRRDPQLDQCRDRSAW